MARSELKPRPNLLFVVAACAMLLFTAEFVIEGEGGFGLLPLTPVFGGSPKPGEGSEPIVYVPMLFLIAPDGDYRAHAPASGTTDALAEQLRAYL